MMIKKKAIKFYNLLYKTMTNPVMQILPGQIAFFFLLSFFPLVLVLGVLAPIFSLSIDNIIQIIEMTLPADTSKLIIPLIQGKSFDIHIFLLIISCLFLISKCTKSIIIASSTIYDVFENNFIKNYIKSIIVTMLLTILFIFVALIPAFGEYILKFIVSISEIGERVINVFNILKWPISFFVIFFIVKLVYTIAPNKQIKSSSVNTGAFITTVLSIILTSVFSFYIVNFSSYNIFYGSVANFIILMLWIYLISYIFVFGMVINVTKIKYDTDNVSKELLNK